MPSLSLQRWNSAAQEELDQIEATHVAVGGPAPGRRYTTQHINQAYTTLLSALFQRFCRDLHSEAIDYFCTKSPANPRMPDASPSGCSLRRAANSTRAIPIRAISAPISPNSTRLSFGPWSSPATRETPTGKNHWRISMNGGMPSLIRISVPKISMAEPLFASPMYEPRTPRVDNLLATLMPSFESNLL